MDRLKRIARGVMDEPSTEQGPRLSGSGPETRRSVRNGLFAPTREVERPGDQLMRLGVVTNLIEILERHGQDFGRILF